MVDMKAVEKYRAELGIPKATIASKCEISVNTYDNWVSKPTMISAVKAKALADALKITEPDRLLAIFFASNAQENVNIEQKEG